ncbi:MAG TPA: hypothetical protein VFE02_12330 [Candidatus Acidoferrales bacterium]|jgi:hypothetical protein|nr:hypothetical protein [Candidatus Acidoferrales bacterium]
MLQSRADVRQPKPGLELSFHSGMGLVTIEAHSERAKKWLEHRFGKVTESLEPRLTKEIPNLGFALCGSQVASQIEADVSELGLVTQWDPASQEEIDTASENTHRYRSAEEVIVEIEKAEPGPAPHSRVERQYIDPYSDNPFLVLGLRSDVSGKDVSRAADRLLKWIEIGEVPEVEEFLPFLEPKRPDKERIKRASKELEDPRIRLRSELYWPSPVFTGFEACQTFLKSGQYSELVSRCEDAVVNGIANRDNAKKTNPQLDAALAIHYLAVFYHASALAGPGGNNNRLSVGAPPSDWVRAFKFWSLVIGDNGFWEYLGSRGRLLNDPRFDASFVSQLRIQLPLEILRINITCALESLEDGDSNAFLLNTEIITESPFGSNTEQALKELATPLQMRFDKILGEIRPALSETAITQNCSTLKPPSNGKGFEGTIDAQKLTAYLYGIEESINKKLIPIGKLVKETGLKKTAPGQEILDSLAYVFRAMSLVLNNRGGMPNSALRLTNLAQGYAAGPDCTAKLAEDQQTLIFLSLQNDALDLANDSRYKESLLKLEEARQFASSDEDRQTVDKWIETANRNIALEGTKAIESAPPLGTVNGIGTKLYGGRNHDSHSGTHVATLYFTFFYIPIVPIAAYRVKVVGTNRYQFYGKVPLARSAFIAPAIIALIILAMVISGNSDNSGVSTTPRVISSPASTTSPTYSIPTPPNPSSPPYTGPPTGSLVTKGELGAWLDWEKTRLDTEQNELDRLIHKSDQDRVNLKRQFAELGSSPSDEEVDYYNRAKDQFNARLKILKARAKQDEADMSRYNSEVDRYNSMS